MTMLQRLPILGAIALLAGVFIGCPPSPRDDAPTQAPVILPAAATPGEPAEVAPTPAPTPVAVPSEKSEDLIYNLKGFDPTLSDAPNDQKGKEPSTDLLSAHAVIDKDRMYVRINFREEMPEDPPSEIRFWLEQERPLVTVEVKLGSQGRPCELSSVDDPSKEAVIEGCFHVGNPLDLSFPLSVIPGVIKVAEPFHVSGFQTCCMDEARNDPFDEISDAQEVFRIGWDATGDATTP
jgi:hypothetical protein